MIQAVIDSSSYVFSPNAMPTLLAAITALLLGLWVVIRERFSPISLLYFLTTLTIAIWLFSFTWMYSAMNPTIAYWWAKLGYLGLPFTPAAVYHFTVVVTREKKPVYLALVNLSWIISVLMSFLIINADLLIQGLYRYPWGYYPKYGTFGVFCVAYCFVMMLLTFSRFWKHFQSAPTGLHRKRAQALFIAFVFFYISSVDFLAKFGFEVYPFGLFTVLIFLGISAYAILRYRLVDLTPAFAVNQILDTMEGAVFVIDPEGQIRFVNPSASRMLGYDETELLNTAIEKICPSECGEKGIHSFISFRDRVMLWKRKNGQSIDVRVSATLVRDSRSHAVIGLVYAAFDITDLTRATNALQESQLYNRTLFERSPIGLALCRMDGSLVDVNEAYANIIGRSVDETLKLTYWDITPKKYADQEQVQLERLNIVGRYGPYEKEYIHKDGHLVPVRLQGNIIEKEGERFIWSSVEDCSERKRAEQAILQKTTELAGANSEREQLQLFAYVASHDLQEPLQKIIGFGELLKSYATHALDEKASDYVERMQNASLRMSRLIEDLLRFSKVTLVQAPLMTCDLNKVVKEVLSDLEMRIHQTKARIEVGRLPVVSANESQMRQLFQNLIANALKFHQKAKPPRIEVKSRNLNDQFYEIFIQDHGIGFDSKYADRIFKPFERLHGPAEYEGSGIGLAICQKIVTRHGGNIRVESAINAGTKFIIELPTMKTAWRKADDQAAQESKSHCISG